MVSTLTQNATDYLFCIEIKADLKKTIMDTQLISKTRPGNTFRLFDAIQKEKLNYVYRGRFTSNITKNILSLAQINMMDKDEPNELKRKVYHVMVEGLQNITKHQADFEQNEGDNCGLFALKKEQLRYFITTGNLIDNGDIGSLSNKINKVNNLDDVQLKDFHRDVLKNGNISEKGGAGLGLIDIARRSGSKLQYAFNPISSNLSYFYLHTEISSAPIIEKKMSTVQQNSIFNYHSLHPMLNDENILMVFNNTFNQEGLMDILSFMEKQIDNSGILKRQMYNVMIEMFQNIIKHGANYQVSTEGKPGLFYIAESETEFILTSGNYIDNNIVRSLRGRINYVNQLDEDTMEDFYSKRLFDFDINTNNGAGLGFIDLRLKSGNKLEFDFQKINTEYSFYTLKVKISKN